MQQYYNGLPPNRGPGVIESITMETFSDRLNYALHIKGYNSAELARSIGIKPQAIQYLRSSKAQSSRFTFEIAAVLKVNPEWLALGKGSIEIPRTVEENLASSSEVVNIFDFSQLTSLDKDGMNSVTPAKKQFIPKSPHNPKLLFGISFPDTSMYPVFEQSSTVLILRTDEAKNGDYVLVKLGNPLCFIIRKLNIKEKKETLTPINGDLFKEIILKEEDKIFGKVVQCTNTYN